MPPAPSAVANRPMSRVPDDAADEVDADDVERVVVAEACTSGRPPGADRPGDDTDGDGADDVDRAAGGGDGDQAGDDAGGGAQRGGLAVRIRSVSSQPRIAAMAAIAAMVFDPGRPAAGVVGAEDAEPTLKPYQPNHSRPAPSMVSVRLCGRIGSLASRSRLPMTSASARPGDTGVDVHRRAAGVVLRADVVGDPAAEGPVPPSRTPCAPTGK